MTVDRCPVCNTPAIWKIGPVFKATDGPEARWLCTDCGSWFLPDGTVIERGTKADKQSAPAAG